LGAKVLGDRLIARIRHLSPFVVIVMLVMGLALGSQPGFAQSFDATHVSKPTDLDGTWLVRGGDDPAWARADLDDSSWTRVDAAASLHDVFTKANPEVVWYRLHVKVEPRETGLALGEYNLASAFEIFVNGERFMQSGRVAPYAAYTYSARLVKPIPDSEIASGSLVIALRVHISANEWGSTNPGYYSYNLTIGQQSALEEHIWLAVIGANAPGWFMGMMALGLGIVALALYSAQPQNREYLWIFLQFVLAAATIPLEFYEYFHNIPAHWDLLRQPFNMASSFCTLLMYIAFLRLGFNRWIRAVCVVAAGGQLLSIFGQSSGTLSAVATVLALFPLLFLIAGVLPVLLVIHWRRGNREAGILLIPNILQCLTYYISILLFFVSQVPGLVPVYRRLNLLLFNYPMGPFVLGIGQLANLLYLLSLAIIMVLRSTRMSRQQAILEGEMAAAQQVQQVLLPDDVEPVQGFTVESAYVPAQQVGGDFFQIIPSGNGGLLLAMGDVAGKGLPAAMLVSVIVGAIRGVAEFTHDPCELLANLNDRLVGRAGGGFATAFVAHIAANGWVSIANAGHLSPYLDGREINLTGALPLGVQPHARYEATEFFLAPGSRLTFYSDGVVEAQNAQGELFGFARSMEISTQPAAAIVAAAKDFGQSDDITVVAITREEAVANAA